MKKQKWLWTFTIFIFISLVGSNVNSSIATQRTWNAGDIFIFGWEDNELLNYYNTQRELSRIDDEYNKGETKINITSIDIIAQRYRFISSTYDSVSSEINYVYAASTFVNDVLNIDDFLSANYAFDRTTNSTVLTSVNIRLPSVNRWFLIDPEWTVINTGFKELFNSSAIVRTVTNFYNNSIVYNVTLGGLFDSAKSYRIMGRNNFDAGVNQFSDAKHRWTFRLDLSGVMGFARYNSTAGYNNYIFYDKYIHTLEFEFQDGGVLKSYLYTIESKITYSDIARERTRTTRFVLGGIKAVSGDISLITFLISIPVTTLVISILKKRKSQ